ncbi:hypothetical protein HaLaN_26084, partial [Haematococcus lacustris]
ARHNRHCALQAAFKASSSQLSALAHMLGFFSPHSSHAHGHAKEHKEREEFTRVLIQDSEDVMGKVMATAHSEAKQCHKQEELHRAALGALQAQLASANEQLSETVSSYNQVVKDLHRQVAEAQEANEAMQRMLEAKVMPAQGCQGQGQPGGGGRSWDIQ